MVLPFNKDDNECPICGGPKPSHIDRCVTCRRQGKTTKIGRPKLKNWGWGLPNERKK
jgi:hypothetical protein